ncbi:ferredoxin reductase family protein [Demequina sp. TTPB684]|uniref:ferredoxin reductase family protein n=1 Tax=unclassified Demequina TaxID=2620311 RepID=UPI001CF296B9|nr:MULTISPECIES: ferredoxin reductase family protein [unclassified Demequina]MCB2413172.1 ferredoxin reductase family protein [Demequina sp. TTPB684]UPU89678.1 ferredoxin reductase family protein [Demequina sp. TMPB413]
MTSPAIPGPRVVAARSWWADMAQAATYVVAAVGVAFFLADGGLQTFATIDYVYSLGRALGIVAAVFMLFQVLLISRAPFIERGMGHDRAAALHSRTGKAAIVLMAAHAGIISVMSAYYADISVIAQSTRFFTSQWYLAMAQIGLGVFAVIFVTSLVMVRSRWRYENWHAVHLLTYVGVALAIPHQFLEGSTFRDGGVAWWFWLTLYVVAWGSLVLFRVVAPLLRFARHDVRVTNVTTLGDGSTSIEMSGRDLDRLGAKPGQFMLWRFLDRERWRDSHPFSLSRVATRDVLRITVKPSGDGSSRLAGVAPGTRVMVEGPFGVFTAAARTHRGIVLIAAGIGITPIRAMLEQLDPAHGPVDVIVRARSRAEAPLLDEVEQIAAAKGVAVHVVLGPRGDNWSSREQHAGLADLVPDVSDRDVFICGPGPWAKAVEQEARAAGVGRDSVHREAFAWSGDKK